MGGGRVATDVGTLPPMRWKERAVLEPYFEKDGQTIYLGDCAEVLPDLPCVDLLLTDPPYGLGDDVWVRSGGNWAGARGRLCNGETPEWDKTTVPMPVMEQAIEKATISIVWGGNHYALPPHRGWLIWDKVERVSMSDAELAWTNRDGPVRVYRMSRVVAFCPPHAESVKQHPTEKPLALMRWCIEQAGDGVATILDCFCGSGTTLVAARDLGRKAIGIEIEERYCEIAAKRLAQGILF